MIDPVTPICAQVFKKSEHAVIGISPFNSYFSDDTIKKLITWGRENFNQFNFYIPDKPNLYTFIALGYDFNKAQKKAHRQGNYIRNKLHRCLIADGFSENMAKGIVISHGTLENNPIYIRHFDLISKQFETNLDFRKGILSISELILKEKRQQPSEESINKRPVYIAAKFLLAELPIIIMSNEIFGKKSSSFCYHECHNFFRYLFQTQRPKLVSNDQAFLVLPKII